MSGRDGTSPPACGRGLRGGAVNKTARPEANIPSPNPSRKREGSL